MYNGSYWKSNSFVKEIRTYIEIPQQKRNRDTKTENEAIEQILQSN